MIGRVTTVEIVFFSVVFFLADVLTAFGVLVIERETVVALVVGVETVVLGVKVEAVIRVVEDPLVLLAELVVDVLLVVLSPASRLLRSFLILCALTPALVASIGVATAATIIAKKQATLDGLHPKSLYTLIEVRLYQKLYQAFLGFLHHPTPLLPYTPKVNNRIQKRFHWER